MGREKNEKCQGTTKICDIDMLLIVGTSSPGADPGGGQHCLGHGQIFGRAKQLFLSISITNLTLKKIIKKQ